MRIALVAPTYLPARRANTIQVLKMAQAFMQLGHTVKVSIPAGPPVAPQTLVEHYGLQFAPEVTWLAARNSLRRYDYGWRATQWAQDWGAELVYTRLPQCATISSLVGQPVIFELHDLPQGRMGPLLLRLFLRGRGAKRVVVISQALAHDLVKRLSLNLDTDFLIVAPDGVDLERYFDLSDPASARQALAAAHNLYLPPHAYVVGYTGHLYSGRGRKLLLQLAGRRPEWIFLLVGGEPEQIARTRELVEKYRLENVVVAGFVPNAHVPLYQAACDALLMPYQEHVAASSGGDIAPYLSPMKLFEYLASGRAILSSDLPALREVLHPGCAVLLPPAHPEAWEQALQALAENPARRAELGAQARSTAASYTWERRAERVLKRL